MSKYFGTVVNSGSFSLPRWAIVAVSLAIILGLQLAITMPRINLPFLDGRMHYYYDNADFTYRARNGILINEPKTQLGITELSYSAWEKPSGEPSFYTHHPFLFKAVFQQYVRFLGDAEWVSRSFALAVSIIASAGIFFGLLLASQSVLAALLGVATMVGIPLFAIFQSCIKYEIDGMAAGAWFFVALALYLRCPSRKRLVTVSVLALLSALVHWTGLILVLVSVAWLTYEWSRNCDVNAGRAAMASGLGSTVGTLMVFCLFAWLKGGWEPLLSDIIEAASTRANIMELPLGTWAQRQLFYMTVNFGEILPWVAGFLAVGLVVRWGWRRINNHKTPTLMRAKDHLMPAFFFGTLITACIWQFAFRQGSYIHIYWQLWFCLPVAGLVAMGFTVARESSKTYTIAAIICCVLLAGWLQSSSYASYRTLLKEPMGIPEDVEFLKSMRAEPFRRFVFLPITQIPMNDWFQGPIFAYYTDRKVEYFNPLMPPRPGDKALMLIYHNQEGLVADIGKKLGFMLVNERCGPSFCSYDLIKR